MRFFRASNGTTVSRPWRIGSTRFPGAKPIPRPAAARRGNFIRGCKIGAIPWLKFSIPRHGLSSGKARAWRGLRFGGERRFAVVLDHELMSGSFDRVVLGLDAGGARVRAAILDFKTDRMANDEEREARRQFYQPQLEAYARALHKLTGLPEEAIQTRLVWID